ncbi:Rieske (2Fe-2S) protein [Halobellus inordinatus]|uniref:Rieske (2Fe-2S) protein n=1 Tax=Halobellus inordinatus TaxID=1126236 RepID=UPI00210E1C57|nr:Rieske (2Fe-2S) protein [Halobellus inordinatus]
MGEHVIGTTDEIDEGERVIVQLEGREVAVFNREGSYFAYLNWCTHQGGPICGGPLTGTNEACFDKDTLETTFNWTREGEILNCPWHGWEFDIESGECLSRQGSDLLSFPVTVDDDEIIVEL